jgi:hypothetical protein
LHKQKQIKTFLLVALYLISQSPAILFHHHRVAISSFNFANSCERSGFNVKNRSNCEHQAHLTTPLEKCSLCDNHTLSPHSIPSGFVKYVTITFEISYSIVATSRIAHRSSYVLSDRGPPAVSSFKA